MSDGVLAITDGTERIDLLSVFKLVDWTARTAAPKGGGVWRESPFLQGRQLVLHEYENIIDTFDLVPIGGGDKDLLIRTTQDLRRLLEKAVAYWVTDWQNEPVWIEARGICETNTRYAVIHDYRTPNDDNPFDDPYVSSSIFEDWPLILEHILWQDVEPGTSTAIEIGATETYDGRNLGNVNSAGTFTPTTANEVYVANKRNVANLTDIYHYDAAPVAWSANLMDAALPFAFLPAVPAVGDIVYFGIDTTIADSGPFCSLVFDIGTAQVDLTITWEYWNGAWVALTVRDNTNAAGAMTGQAFDTTGVNSVHWNQPSDWAGTAINAITAYWVRARVTAIGAAPAPPTQQNRDIYSVVWPYVDVDSDQLTGDIEYLIDHWYRVHSATSTQMFATRAIIGSRSVNRGSNFTAFINYADEQNPANVTIDVASYAGVLATSINYSPTGRVVRWTPGAVITSTYVVNIQLAYPLTEDYTGTYRLFCRVVNDTSGGGNVDDFTVQYTIGDKRGGLPAGFVLTKKATTRTQNEIELLDFGQITLDGVDQTELNFTPLVTHNAATASVINFVDLILIPTDEFVIDALSSSIVANTYGRIGYAAGLTGDYRTYLKITSASEFKNVTIAYLYVDATDLKYFSYIPIQNGKFSINSNRDVRLWHLADSPYDSKESEIEVAARIQISGVAQYLGMRGDR